MRKVSKFNSKDNSLLQGSKPHFNTAWELYEDDQMLQRLEERENKRFLRDYYGN